MILNVWCAARMSRGGHHLGKLYIFSVLLHKLRHSLLANLFNRNDLVTWLFTDAIANPVNLVHPDTNSKSRTG